MEISVFNTDTIIHKDKWPDILRAQVRLFLNGNNGSKRDGVLIIFKREEKYKGCETAWRKLCREEYHKQARVKIIISEAGRTLMLWWK